LHKLLSKQKCQVKSPRIIKQQEGIHSNADASYCLLRVCVLCSFNAALNKPGVTPDQAEKIVALSWKFDRFDVIFYGQLSHIYAREGDIDGVLSVAQRAKEGMSYLCFFYTKY